MGLGRLGTTELLIVLAIVILVFGVGRIGKLGKDLGQGIREFRTALSGNDEASEEPEPEEA